MKIGNKYELLGKLHKIRTISFTIKLKNYYYSVVI